MGMDKRISYVIYERDARPQSLFHYYPVRSFSNAIRYQVEVFFLLKRDKKISLLFASNTMAFSLYRKSLLLYDFYVLPIEFLLKEQSSFWALLPVIQFRY